MATGKETFRKAIEFQAPDYLPGTIEVDFNFLRDKNAEKLSAIKRLLDAAPNDMVCCSCWMDQSEARDGVVYKRDEWNVLWQDDGHGMITTYHPMEEGYEHIGRVHFPDTNDTRRFIRADKQFGEIPGRYKLATVWFTLFERLWMLRGFNNMLMDPYLNESDFMALKERILDINLAMIDQWTARHVDGVFFSDDWGSQKSLLMNPDDWRKYYKDDYRRMFDRVHKGNAHVWMHLCGNITPILPDLIDIGLNVLNPVQPQAMDMEKLAREFGGHLCFNGGVDVQGTMINGSTNDVKNEFRRLVDLFGKYRGGYIAGTSHSIMPETPLDNIIALLEAVNEYR